jgi:hypothetical protein
MYLVTATIKGSSFKLTHTFLCVEHARIVNVRMAVLRFAIDHYTFAEFEVPRVVQLMIRDADEIPPPERARLVTLDVANERAAQTT